jgi:predicted transcriptional regulator
MAKCRAATSASRSAIPFQKRHEDYPVESERSALVELTSRIVAAYVSHNPVAAVDLPVLIASTHAALSKLNTTTAQSTPVDIKPKVAPRKSITPDFLICLEDGKKFKSLKRHLRTHYNMSPEQYRAKWDLPVDYPMVAPNYAKARSTLAKQMGLGTRREREG